MQVLCPGLVERVALCAAARLVGLVVDAVCFQCVPLCARHHGLTCGDVKPVHLRALGSARESAAGPQ